jgi:hypothetical protein
MNELAISSHTLYLVSAMQQILEAEPLRNLRTPIHGGEDV